MTRNELRAALANYSGLIVADDGDAWMSCTSPSGIKVAEVGVFTTGPEDGWRISHVSQAFPDAWKVLRSLHNAEFKFLY